MGNISSTISACCTFQELPIRGPPPPVRNPQMKQNCVQNHSESTRPEIISYFRRPKKSRAMKRRSLSEPGDPSDPARGGCLHPGIVTSLPWFTHTTTHVKSRRKKRVLSSTHSTHKHLVDNGSFDISHEDLVKNTVSFFVSEIPSEPVWTLEPTWDTFPCFPYCFFPRSHPRLYHAHVSER
jgi:hypothetical protein